MFHLQKENARKEEVSPIYMALVDCYEVSKIVAFYLTITLAIKSNDSNCVSTKKFITCL